MTNKEKLQEIFPNMIFEGTVMMYKPTEQVLASRINYNWLNTEYEEPITENCIAYKYDETEEEDGEHCKKCLAGDNQFELDKEFVDSTIKNNLAVDKLISDCEKMSFDIDFFNKPLKVVALDAVKNIVNDLPTVTPQEPIIDKIRAEIESIDTSYYSSVNGVDMTECAEDIKHGILQIIDKYKAESEDKE